jgi:D-alanine-D-alanine ligase
MKKIDKYIEIVGSTNPRINAMASYSRASIAAVLSKIYTKVQITIVNDMTDLEALAAKKPDLVVLGMKSVLLDPSKGSDDSPKVWLSEYLKQNGIASTGSDTDALHLQFDKHEAKQVAIDAGLRSARYFISRIKQPSFDHDLRFPLFVKPTNRGGSKGIDEKSVVYSDADLRTKVSSIHNDYSSDALIEEFLPGREFSVAVVRLADSDDLVAMPIEITTPADKQGNRFLSEFVKRADLERVLEVSDSELKAKLSELAIGVFEALGSRDYGRIDMRLDSDGNPNFIEANLMPGLSNHGYLSRCFDLNGGIAYEDMITSIVSLAFERTDSFPAEPDSYNLLARFA